MLAYVIAEKRSGADACLAAVASVLVARGHRLAGAVQRNPPREGRPCDMVLEILGSGRSVPISQDLGASAKGCRLDPAALETVVALVDERLDAGAADLVVVNKFGRHEGEGRGFRALIGRALAEGIPVLTAVNAESLPAFLQFAEGMATPLAADEAEILGWCREALAP